MPTKTATKRKTTKKRTTKKKASGLSVLATSLLLALLGIVLTLSMLTDLFGVFGSFLKMLLLGLLGAGGYILPLLILYAAFQYAFDRQSMKFRMGIALLLTLIFSALYNSIRFRMPEASPGSSYLVTLTKALFEDGYQTLTSGGVLGGYLSAPFIKLCSQTGAIVIFAAALALPLIVFGIKFWALIRPDDDAELLPEKKKSGKKVEKELKEIKKDLQEIKSTQQKAEKKEETKKSRPLTPEEELSQELDDIEKPYKDAVDKLPASKKRARVEKLEEPPRYEPEPVQEPVSEPVPAENTLEVSAGEDKGIDDDDLLIPLTVKPRKPIPAEITSGPELVDEVQQEILRKVREAEEREEAAALAASLAQAGAEEPVSVAEPQEEDLTAGEAFPEEEDEDLFGEEKPPVDLDLPSPSDMLKKKQAETAEAAAPAAAVPAADPAQPPVYVKPPLSLLNYVPQAAQGDSTAEMQKTAEKLMEALRSFNVETKVIDASRGPTVTRYELQPLPGVKISRITNLSDDIALHLAATGVRLEAPIPGKAAIGVEIPNKTTSTVYLEELVKSDEFTNAKSALSVCLGKDIGGNNVVIDLARMPHLLIAGATGSGKSVCINSIIISLLYHSSPEDVRLIMVDPKVVELNVYNGIPHLLIPVVTDPRKAAGALGWAVGEMLKRYELFKEKGVRDFAGYNRNLLPGESKLPQIVIIIDEMADLMMTSPTEVEDAICRLAQMARAAGMHLVVATQRPSATVITGTIKANIPSRIAFAVSSGIDSRIIIDASGAEKLIGKGDMLYDPLGATKPLRVQGCFVSDKEVEAVVSFIKENHTVEYDQAVLNEIERKAAEQANKGRGSSDDDDEDDDDDDAMLPQAIEVVVNAGQASTSTLQRKLKLGYARAARIMDQMEERGIIGPYQGSKPREVMITRQQWLEMKNRSEGKFE